jgi:two-component system, OmpR family, response regulator
LLTALGTVDERVKGLQSGADDYLVKPFAFPELLARLEAIRRRTLDRPSTTTQAAGLTLDLSNRRVSYNNREIDLTPTEFSLLELLMRHVGNVVTRSMVSEHIWDTKWEGETNVIEAHMTRLRSKLEKAGAGEAISTVRGRGYVLRNS